MKYVTLGSIHDRNPDRSVKSIWKKKIGMKMQRTNSTSMILDHRAAWGRKYLSSESTNVGQKYTLGSPVWSRIRLCMTCSKCLWNCVGPSSFWRKKYSSLGVSVLFCFVFSNRFYWFLSKQNIDNIQVLSVFTYTVYKNRKENKPLSIPKWLQLAHDCPYPRK